MGNPGLVGSAEALEHSIQDDYFWQLNQPEHPTDFSCLQRKPLENVYKEANALTRT